MNVFIILVNYFEKWVKMQCDILIIGAGVLGLSSAYHLKKRNPSKKIVVIDKFSGPGQGNSSKSQACFRNIFTSEVNFLLADSTINAFSHFQNTLGYDIKLRHIGYLWLFSDNQYKNLDSIFKTIRKRGASTKTYTREELMKNIPTLVLDFFGDEEAEIMGLESIEIGILGTNCGCIDADAMVRCYEREFLKLGGITQYGVTAKDLLLKPKKELEIPGEPFIWQDLNIIGAETNIGQYKAEKTVIAAGAWSERLLDPIGFNSLMKPKKRQIFVFKNNELEKLFNIKDFNKYNTLPYTALPKGSISIRSELTEKSIWLSCPDDLGRSFGLEDDPQAEEKYYTNNIYHLISKYFPCFLNIQPINMWAGQYALNSYDKVPIVVSAPGMIYVGAASGSGFMKSDSLGRIVAAEYSGEIEAELFDGRTFRVSNIGVEKRNVEKELFVGGATASKLSKKEV
jgi:glycine/D-amino acid oxidase-like deaminating enzyme